jgi:release factor glutamine methyltransferase
MQKLKKSLLGWVPEHEANLILLHVLRKKNPSLKIVSDLILNSITISESCQSEAMQLACERAKGIPLQHLLGTQYFLNHEYQVNSTTLIPRPETEVLANLILEHCERKFLNRKLFRFAELGLGSGVLSVELLAAAINSTGVASELSPGAIALAEKNLTKIVGPSWSSRFHIVQAKDALEGFQALLSRGPFDLVFSNPPYVSRNDEIEPQVLNFEPETALFPLNHDSNFFYEDFIRNSKSLLAPDGVAFFEVPHERASEILGLFQRGGFTGSKLMLDLTSRPRVIEVHR